MNKHSMQNLLAEIPLHIMDKRMRCAIQQTIQTEVPSNLSPKQQITLIYAQLSTLRMVESLCRLFRLAMLYEKIKAKIDSSNKQLDALSSVDSSPILQNSPGI